MVVPVSPRYGAVGSPSRLDNREPQSRKLYLRRLWFAHTVWALPCGHYLLTRIAAQATAPTAACGRSLVLAVLWAIWQRIAHDVSIIKKTNEYQGLGADHQQPPQTPPLFQSTHI